MTIRTVLLLLLHNQSQRALAKSLGVSGAEISRILSGQRSGQGKVAAALLVRYPEHRDAISDALGLTNATQ